MPRIPAPELERLKEDISVQRLVEAAGIELKQSGKDLLGACPFHADREPSLVITPSKNLWHCFACQIGGGPLDWVMKFKGVSFRHAVELLKADSSLVAPSVAPAAPVSTPVKRSTVRALPAPVARDADDQQLLNDTITYYHERLKQSPEGLGYLAARGLGHPELIDTFRLGLADRTLGLRLPEKNRKAGADLRTRLQQIGLLRDSGHEHFNGSLVIPIFDAGGPLHGQVVEVYGRKIRDDLRPGTPKHLYLPGPHAGVFNRPALSASKEIILCEALIDALTFWCAGYRHVTSAYGVEGFTDELLAAFQQHGTERVLIAYDRDEAGERAAAKLAPRLMAVGIECLRVTFPKGMDANSTALKLTPAAHSLGLLLRQAEWIGRGPSVPVSSLAAPFVAPAVAPCTPEASVTAARSEVWPETLAEVLPETPPAAAPDEWTLVQGERHWRVRGWHKNTSPEQMRINLQVRRMAGAVGEVGEVRVSGYHVDTLDLYAARSRAAYLRQAALELSLPEDLLKSDLGQVLFQLEALQDERLRQAQAPKRATPILDAQQEKQALALLQSPDLIERIVADLERCGVVGEAHNLLAGYLAAVSRKLDAPLAILIQSSSAAGKSSLMEAVLALIPPEDKVQYSAMTGQSLFYLGETDMQHKILAIAEEEGVRQAAYALKLLQSDGILTMAATGKDDRTGNLTTKNYTVRGPVMLMMTTTAIDVDEELMNRCLVLSVNESRAQTQAIHARQRRQQTLAGLLATAEREAIMTLHQNAQRLLQAVRVVNPYADRLTFLDDKTRTRRDHMKYLSLIRAIALLHQHQRAVKTVALGGPGDQTLAYIEVTKADIALANRIAHDVLGRTLDELPPQTRRLLTQLQTWVEARALALKLPAREFRFTRRAVREALSWGDTQLKLHLSRLADLEYLTLQRRGTLFEYELVYDGKGDGRHLCGLMEVSTLGDDSDRSGDRDHRSGFGRPSVGPRSGPGRGAVDIDNSQQACGFAAATPVPNGRFEPNALFHANGTHPVVAAG